MTRYYFDTDDGERFTPDEEGMELDGLDEAKKQAMVALPEMARDVLPDGDRREFVVTVRDGSTPVLRVHLVLSVQAVA